MVGLDGRFWTPMTVSAPAQKRSSVKACDERILYFNIKTENTKFTLHLIAGPGKELGEIIKKIVPWLAGWQIRILLYERELFNPGMSLTLPLPVPILENLIRLACCKGKGIYYMHFN